MAESESDFYRAAESPISDPNGVREQKLKILQDQLAGNPILTPISTTTEKPIFEPEIESNKPHIIQYSEDKGKEYRKDKDYIKVKLIFGPELNLDPLYLLVLDITPVSELLIFIRIHVKVGRWSTLELLCRNDKVKTENDEERMFPVSCGKLIMEIYNTYGFKNKLKVFCFLQNAFG